MDFSILFMGVGFLLAAYSVIANDSVQTLGTFMSSNRDVRWQYMWAGASAVLIFTLLYGWSTYGGDISFGRLNKIPHVEVQWYHALAPAVLLVLTRVGIPVSTSFLVLSAFASGLVLEKMLMKSVMGYGVAAVCAYGLWWVVSHFLDERHGAISDKNAKKWRVAQWCSTGLLWYMWLSHDVANISVFLPREIPFEWLLVIIAVFVALLGFMFYERGGKIQNIVTQKTSTQYVRSATLVDLAYALILWYFKIYNDIPMSTTFVFVGLLAGREFAIATVLDKKIKRVFPMVMRDFFKLTIGIVTSILIAMFIHYGL